MRKKPSLLFGALAIVTSCANAPVQEMSDARQAVRSAEEAGAMRYSPQQLQAALQLLEQAQSSLEAGAYLSARRLALEAREKAIQARKEASSEKSIH